MITGSMDDTSNNQSQINPQDDIAVGTLFPTLPKEAEPMSSLNRNVEVAQELKEELPPEEETKSNDFSASPTTSISTELTQLEKEIKKEEVIEKNKALGSTHMSMTLDDAKKKVKGPLIFKNSSDPMLWFSWLVIRHFQLLEKKEKENKQ